MRQTASSSDHPERSSLSMRSRVRSWAAILLASFMLQAGLLWASDETTQTIAVLAHRGNEDAFNTWQPTADYLTRALPGYKFQILPLEHAALEEAVAQQKVDFVLCNPADYVVLEARHRITRIVTLQKDFRGQPLKEFGGLIFTRADRKDLGKLSDLKGRRIASVASNAFGSYQMQMYELMKAGIDPSSIKPVFVGLPQDQIVTMVAEGKVDAGFIRSGLLESMAAAGKIKLDDFRGINLDLKPNYPFWTSTALYPEWAFATTQHVNVVLASRVAIALLSLPPDSDAAKGGKYHGWSIPLSYNSVREMMRALRAPPYDAPENFSLGDIARKYNSQIMIGLLSLLGLLGFFMRRFFMLNRNLSEQMTLINEHSHSLAIEIDHRTIAERQLANENHVLELLAQEAAQPMILQAIAEMCQNEFHDASVALFLREETTYRLAASSNLSEVLCKRWNAVQIQAGADEEAPDAFASVLTGDTRSYLSEGIQGSGNAFIGQLVLFSAAARPQSVTRPLLRVYSSLASLAIQRSIISDRVRLASSVFQNALEGIVICGTDGHIIDISPSFTRLTGYSRSEAIGQTMRLVRSGRHDAHFYNALWTQLLERGHWTGEIWNRTKDGRIIAEMLQISSVKDNKGKVTHFVGTFSDITTLKEAQSHLEKLATFDILTGLPNRGLLSDRLNQALSQAQRRDKLLAICFLDLDGFKAINDTFGHEAGDILLREVAKRLTATVRAGDTVARLGGDEFVLLLGEIKDVDELEIALQRLLRTIAEPYDLMEQQSRISTSIGVTLFPFDDGDPDSLLRHADQAMYRAKQDGRNRYHMFDSDYATAHQLRIVQRDRLRAAIGQQELVLHYQPQISLHGKGVSGVEALLRWQHPEKGLMPPGEFLPNIEHDDLICEIGIWVLREALTQQRQWKAQGTSILVSVNIAARQFLASQFISDLEKLLAEFPDRIPGGLELEILETAAIEDTSRMIQVIEHCHNLDVQFALDDFGTGYSSLTYLHQLPADTIKIDRSFINGIFESRAGLAIIEAIIGLANAFQCKLVAEGIETLEQGEFLARMGCGNGQGFFIARPMPATEIIPWIASFQLPASWAAWRDITPSSQDFPLVLAEFEHRWWVKDLLGAVEGSTLNTSAEAIDNPHRCKFGRWLDQYGRVRYGMEPHFIEVDRIHVAIHDIGRQIHQCLLAGNTDEARSHVPKLQQESDTLVAALGNLQRHVAQAAKP